MRAPWDGKQARKLFTKPLMPWAMCLQGWLQPTLGAAAIIEAGRPRVYSFATGGVGDAG